MSKSNIKHNPFDLGYGRVAEIKRQLYHLTNYNTKESSLQKLSALYIYLTRAPIVRVFMQMPSMWRARCQNYVLRLESF